MDKLTQTAKSRKFLVCAAASAFLTLNWHFGWMPMEIALAIVAPFLGWVGVEGYMDAQKTKDGGVADALKAALSAYTPNPNKPDAALEEVTPLPGIESIARLENLDSRELSRGILFMTDEIDKMRAELERRKKAKETPKPQA